MNYRIYNGVSTSNPICFFNAIAYVVVALCEKDNRGCQQVICLTQNLPLFLCYLVIKSKHSQQLLIIFTCILVFQILHIYCLHFIWQIFFSFDSVYKQSHEVLKQNMFDIINLLGTI